MEKHSKNAAPSAPPRARMAPFQSDPTLVAIGKTLAVQIFNSRDWSSLRHYLNDANSRDDAIRRNGLTVMFGFALMSTAVLRNIHNGEHVRFTGSELPTGESVIYKFKTDINAFLVTLNRITQTMADVMRAAPYLTARADGNAPPPAPVPVSVVSLPARVTETSIERDTAGEIKRTSQIEVDFKKPADANI